MPAWLPHYNRLFFNRIQGVWASVLPPWAKIVHKGRRSGKEYRTPVVAFKRGNMIMVMLPYGDTTDWVRNLLAAGGGGIERSGRLRRIAAPRVVDATSNDPLPLPVRLGARYLKVLVADIVN
jgi:deazaflavin-dependent oxidoreductase (nitroreductase family)